MMIVKLINRVNRYLPHSLLSEFAISTKNK